MRQTLVKSAFAPTFVPSGIVTSAMKAKALTHAALLVADEVDAVDAELGGADETDDVDDATELDALAELDALLELVCPISCETVIEIAAGSLVMPAELYDRTIIV